MAIHRAALVASLLVAARAEAGHVVEMTDSDGRNMTLRIEGKRWRIDSSAAKGDPRSGPPGIVIYDGETRTFYVADPETKSYRAMEQGQLEARMSQMQAQLKEAMAKMTPEQRKQLEQAMKGHAGMLESEPPKIEYEKTGRTGSAAGHRCTFHRERVEGDPDVAEVCIASFEAVGVRKDEFTALGEWPGLPGARSGAASVWASSPGVPLIRESRGPDGKLREDLRVTSLKRASLPPQTFEVPAGYARKDG